MRTIDADALGQNLQKMFDANQYENPEFADAVDTIARFVEDAPTVPQWISVEERLPEIEEHYTSKTVLAYLDNGGYTFTEAEQTPFGDIGFSCERIAMYNGDEFTVTHWMPLPPPPKRSKE